jgi:Fe-S-cluster containining protein
MKKMNPRSSRDSVALGKFGGLDIYKLISDPVEISKKAALLEDENEGFRNFIQAQDAQMVDDRVASILPKVEEGIDCTACGACCRELMINVTEDEIEHISKVLHQDSRSFKEAHIEQSTSGEVMVMNTIPCHFLADSKCSVYENRFTECREFPHLHKPNLSGRMFGTLMHYGRCPIIYNVIEILKNELNFITEKKD